MRSRQEAQSMRGVGAVRDVLVDPDHGRSANLLRLQGWRGRDLDQACAAGAAARIAPAVCAAGALVAAATGSALVALAFAAAAVVGVVADNHPVETLYNLTARWRGRAEIPVNRAGKRLGCTIGAVLLIIAGVGFSVGATPVGSASAALLGAVAGFVAATNLCVPSLLLTLVAGSERTGSRDLF